jgi:ankyrin repeat protein
MTTNSTYDFTRLMYLLDTNNLEDARLLLKHQPLITLNNLFDKFDHNDNPLLHRYVLRNQPDAVHLLLEYGASVYSVNKYGWLPIHLAAYCGQDRTIIQYLLEFEKR